MKCVIVDNDIGNLGALKSMCERIGMKPFITRETREILKAKIVFLSGVGSFSQGVASLDSLDLRKALVALKGGDNLLVGICLGMQLMLSKSSEGLGEGLGLIEGECKRFSEVRANFQHRIPHMGWNRIRRPGQSEIVDTERRRYYFVHSYVASPSNLAHIIYETRYGVVFPSVIRDQNVIGIQFHPEKSSISGQLFMKEVIDDFFL
jgi:glutamine amidotransferase